MQQDPRQSVMGAKIWTANTAEELQCFSGHTSLTGLGCGDFGTNSASETVTHSKYSNTMRHLFVAELAICAAYDGFQANAYQRNVYNSRTVSEGK